ncbi:MAG: SIS domain-containing protein [Gammaproteobacteria bacterium]|nr:SIS domain-containing protein [Gammaproteobacteria bacterium]MBU2056857.1 SIS domain-containing protein [Gammaproteobacteria bacterium]MBU2174611.1 SIS domain-containing protein [Gammaproteobacteria bacterium]MBU2248304.1 SIS domain-containing protein [Gammaproteobacteria bacterium]MBU2346173.1 SIS domain-containing protein [Gammaproteobacteria bacterium]
MSMQNIFLQLGSTELEQAGGYWTAREIQQQPDLWRQVQLEHQQKQPALQQFLQPLLAKTDLRIILTGAGTSAYIGAALAAFLQQQLPFATQKVEAISTTDLVSHPSLYLDARLPTLLVSYGRSGNSPESVAAVELADQLVPTVQHLMITCNADGKLASYAKHHPERSAVYQLPEQSHDQSFAMTSSFSSMYLATLLTFAAETSAFEQACTLADHVLQHKLPEIKAQAEQPCQRMVFLGSGPLKAIAQEAALKYLELTAGQVISSFESPLGFRHGPKSLINSDTQILVLQSSDPYSSLYDQDLLAELQKDNLALDSAVLSEAQLGGDNSLPDVWLTLPFIVWCQALAFYKALQLKVSPDNPCPGGQVNRVVQGVTLYPLKG